MFRGLKFEIWIEMEGERVAFNKQKSFSTNFSVLLLTWPLLQFGFLFL